MFFSGASTAVRLQHCKTLSNCYFSKKSLTTLNAILTAIDLGRLRLRKKRGYHKDAFECMMANVTLNKMKPSLSSYRHTHRHSCKQNQKDGFRHRRNHKHRFRCNPTDLNYRGILERKRQSTPERRESAQRLTSCTVFFTSHVSLSVHSISTDYAL
jgi:hypothetical protein